jgi:hypothetical protein
LADDHPRKITNDPNPEKASPLDFGPNCAVLPETDQNTAKTSTEMAAYPIPQPWFSFNPMLDSFVFCGIYSNRIPPHRENQAPITIKNP